MAKLKIADLDTIARDVNVKRMFIALGYRVRITVHTDTCGLAAGAAQVYEALVAEVDRGGYSDVLVSTGTCLGLCGREPMITVEVKGGPSVIYGGLTAESARRVFWEHVIGGKVLQERALAQGALERDYPKVA